MEHHALVQRVAETAEFQARLSALGKGAVVCLDHVTPEATAFATALVIARARLMQRRLWVLCPDVRVQDHVHAELLVWQCPALYFPRQIQQVGEALPDPDSMAERVSVLGRWGGGQGGRQGGHRQAVGAGGWCPGLGLTSLTSGCFRL